MKSVSICIPAYEQPENLDKCLESILYQTFQDFEVIITDDSKSNSLQSVVDKYNEKMDIIYIKNSINKGSPENWNESIKLAQGKYIKILHHDDYLYSNESLKKFVDLIESEDNSIAAFCSSRHVNSDREYLSSHILNKKKIDPIKNNANALIFGNILGAPSAMIYKNGLDISFDKRMKWLVDIDFYIRLLKNNKFTYTTEELVCINIAEDTRVTNSCIDDKKINIYETMIMFEKFNLRNISLAYKLYFCKLFLRFNVLNRKDIESCGYYGSIHNQIKGLFRCVFIMKPFYYFYKKAKRLLKKVIY